MVSRFGIASAAIAVVLASPAWAGTATDKLDVAATVQTGCNLNGGSISFGQYTAGQTTALDAVGEVRYASCIGTLKIELDGGQSGSTTSRQMLSGSNKLTYQLYRNSNRDAIWGTGTNAHGVQLFQTLSGKIDVYGRIPAGQNVQPGTYTDTVNITMTY